MAPEAMMTVCGLVIRPLRHDQQPGCTQDIEQAIPANLDACLGQGRAQHVLELARTQARLAQP